MEQLVLVARTGDQEAFAELVEPLRHELQVHCYRMLGSVEDAEDAVQETLLRAWTRIDSYAGRASFRAWAYGIATHACLDALRRRKARSWPTAVAPPADPLDYQFGGPDLPWLQPYPDRLLDAAEGQGEPESVAVARETIELAFLTAIQQLPARQRAVLILRDTLDWSVRDTADALEMTLAAVNSALQRAHAGLAEHLPPDRGDWRVRSSAEERQVLSRLISAWEDRDPSALVKLLRDDAQLVMPPETTWFQGKSDVGRFLTQRFEIEREFGWRGVPVAANRQPAFALYRGRSDSAAPYAAFGIVVVQITPSGVRELSLFRTAELFGLFELPPTL
ncbi:MAG: RNA polymerase subunit sigma-70 [Nocardioidaceae bacterium]